MKIKLTELRRTIRRVIVESKAEEILNLPQSPSPMAVYQAVMQWMSDQRDPSSNPDASLVDQVIHNVMVKHQVSRTEDDIGQKLNMLRQVLDSDLGRRQSYRRGIEDEMREIDPTGHRQTSGQLVRQAGRAEKTYQWDDENIGWKAKMRKR